MTKEPPPAYSSGPETAPGPGYSTVSTTITSSPVAPLVFGPNPQNITCPSCHYQITTAVKTEASTKTHIIALLLCGLWCCCLPYFIDSCQNRNHYCPSCNAYLGAYSN